jgi:mono/diheme cytochrome c family protein
MRGLCVLFCLAAATLASAGEPLTRQQQRGKEVFQACRGCHNTLTDARKSGPSLRVLFGKVRLINGKRTNEENVAELILGGYNGMPAYRNMFRPEEWADLMSYLKTLDARPEFGGPLKPIRGSDQDILNSGEKLYGEHCQACHEQPGAPKILDIFTRDNFTTGERVTEAAVVAYVHQGHGGMLPKKDALADADLFALLAFLKAKN